jgi:hypothetical protein
VSISKNPSFDLNVLMDAEIHSDIHFLWLRGASNEKTISQIKETYGDRVIHVRSVQRSTHDFAGGRMEVDVLPRLDRPMDPENGDRISELLEREP